MSDKGYRTIHDHHHHIGWDNSLEAVLRVDSGAELSIGTVDSSGGQIKADSDAVAIAEMDFGLVNPVTGPVWVEGAEPGDVLEVEYLGFSKAVNWGWTGIIPGFGLLADEFTDPFLHISKYDTELVHFTDEIKLPFRAFTGTVGNSLAEPGNHSVVPPRRVGGNLDIRDLNVGSRLYLPIEVQGALFSLGDTHAAQGDGEVCGTAIETAMDVQVKLTLHKGMNLPAPQFEIPSVPVDAPADRGYYATTGVGPDTFAAAQDAIRAMIDHLGREYGLEPNLAYALCSVAVNLKISEIVDMPNVVVSAYLPKGIFR